MIKRYNDFLEHKVNEEAEFGGTDSAKGIGKFMKNILGSLVNDLKDEFKKPLGDFNKKISNTKDTKKMKEIVEKYLINHKDTLENSFKEVSTPIEIKDTIESNLRSIYASIKASVENFGDEKYTFEEIFKGSSDNVKKLMDKNEKTFSKKVGNFSEKLVLSFGKNYDVTKDNINLPKKEIEKQIINPEGDSKLTQDNIEKLKNDIKLWFETTFYKNVQTTLKTVDDKKGDKEKQNTGSISDKIDKIPDDVTSNKDSVKKIIDKLVDSDKKTIINVRNELGLDKSNTPI